jgi:hypothetical protein
VHDYYCCEDCDGPEDDENFDPYYLKYCFDGAVGLAELSARLRELADDFDERAAGGWRMQGCVEGGWATLVRDPEG